MKNIKRYIIFFTIGGTGYAAIELLWRGRTHWTMIIAGGICFVIFSILESHLGDKPLLLRVILASGFITLLELIFGIVFNIILGMRIWDYSKMPLNLFGQICPVFSLFWAGLSLAALPLARLINKKIKI